jgi:hypothetical protein
MIRYDEALIDQKLLEETSKEGVGRIPLVNSFNHRYL